MHHYKETFETWNKVASLYEEKFMDLNLYDESYDFICGSITKQHAEILDIGCGPGNIAKYVLAKRPDFKLHGIDVAPAMVKLAQKNNPTATFTVMDSRAISELRTTYDAIVCGFCLPYLSPADGARLIRDTFQLLNNGGLLYLSFVEGEASQSGFQVGSTGDRSYFYFYNLQALQNQLLGYGFRYLRVFKVAYPKSATETEMHTILIARKGDGVIGV